MSGFLKTIAAGILLSSIMALNGFGQEPSFTYGDMAKGMFRAKTVDGVRPMADGEHYTAVGDGAVVRYRYRDGKAVDTLFNGRKSALPGGKFSSNVFSGDERLILLTSAVKPIYRRSFTADNWIYDRERDSLRRLTPEGRERDAAFSPDGRKAAFVRDNDIWVVDLSDYSLKRITEDGKFNHIINGATDWVYEEEFAFTRAFEWSPDSRRIAYLRFDESAVPEFTMMRFQGKLYPEPYTYKYPKAGEPNSVVEIHVADLEACTTNRVDTGTQTDQYIPRIGWTDEGRFWFYRVNRLQNRFELMLADGVSGNRGSAPAGGNGVRGRVPLPIALPPVTPVPARAVYTETSDRYVERVDDGTVTFLPGTNRFIVRSERDGFMHLYLYDTENGLVNPITSGDWEVTGLLGAAGNKVWFLSTEESPLRRNLYVTGLDGKGKKRLTGVDAKGMASERGTYRIAPGRGFGCFISYFSNAGTPNLVRLHTGDGRVVRVLEDNAALREKLAEKKVPAKEYFTVPAADGTPLGAYRILPEGFDSTGAVKYPVLMVQYSGPGSQQVADKWGMDWPDAVVQHGYIVVCVDGRGTGFRGAEFKKCTYGNLGKTETEDQIAAAKWIGTQPWADASRIGIFGWSYGGFMALNCILKGNDVFKMAISVAPVTSWRYYDSIYTEIYNGLPQDNAAGYDDNSPIHFADRLKGSLLLVHGTGDDNVHVQNGCEMASALVRAGKQFDMMVYPDDNHSMRPTGYNHALQKMVDYTLSHL